jgi:predicted N-acyltransferase
MTSLAAPVSSWSIDRLEGASALDAHEWNALARRGFHIHQWFHAAEESGWRARHVVVREGPVARAVIPAYLTGGDTPQDLHDRWLGPLRGLERIGLGLRPVLSVQSPFSLTSDPLGDTGALPRGTLAEAFDRLEESAVREHAKAVVWPFLDPSEHAVLALARDRGYAVIDARATSKLRVSWDSYDEYVASRRKSVRRTIRSDLAGLGTAGLESVSHAEYRAEAAEMDALYRLAYRRRNGRDARIAPGYFGRLAAAGDSGILAQLTRSRDRIVGMSVNLAAGSLLRSRA